MADGTILVQSFATGAGYPVAVDTRVLGGGQVAAVQHMLGVDVRSDVGWSVRSYAGANPLAVALTDPTGAHTAVLSTWVVNTPSVLVAGQPTVTASLVGQATVTASVPGQVTVTASVAGVAATVASAWVANTPTVLIAGQPTVTASVLGQLTVTASLVGAATVVASVIGQPTVTASIAGTPAVTGSVFAIQQGSWTTNVSQVTSPWIVQAGSSNVPLGTITASVIGAPTVVASVIGQPTVTASVVGTVSVVATVTQATSPWIVQVASTMGGGSTVTGSVFATEQGSWGVLLYGVASGLGANVRSWGTGGLLMVSLEQGTLSAGANGAVLDFTNAAIGATVTSFQNAAALNVILTSSGGLRATVASDALGGILNVNLARGTITGGGNGATLDFVNNLVGATVRSMANASTQLVTLTDTVGNTLWPLVVVGSVGASQLGSWTVVASVIGQPTVTASVIGQVTATASVVGQVTVTASVAGVPSVVASVIGQPTMTASVIGAVSVVASVIGQATVTASLVGIPTVVGSAFVQGQVASGTAMAGNPLGAGAIAFDYAQSSVTQVGCGQMVGVVADRMGRLRIAVDTGTIGVGGQVTVTASVVGVPTVVGSVGVTQSTSPWISQLASSNVFLGSVVASMIGQATVTASVLGQVTVTASVLGQLSVTASLVGAASVVASVIGQPTVTASLAGVPTFIGSVAVQGQVASGAVMAGNPVAGGALAFDTVQTSVTQVGCGQAVGLIADRMGHLRVAVDTGTVAIAGQPTVTASVVGVLSATTSAWVANTPSVLVAGQPTVTASVIGVATVIGSAWVSQVTSPWIVQVASTMGGGTSVTGSVVVTQGSSPWIVTGSVFAIQQGSWTTNVSQVTSPWIVQVASTQGQGTVTASVVGIPTVVGSVTATQGNTPWLVVASLTGQPTATVSVAGVPTVVGSVLTIPSYRNQAFVKVASQVGSALSFPFIGTTASAFLRQAPTVNSATAQLGFDVYSGDLAGLLFTVVTSGSPGCSVPKVITGWSNQGSQIVTLSPAWTAQTLPNSGDAYALLIDCRGATALNVKTELSSATNIVGFAIGLYDYGATILGSVVPPTKYVDDIQWTDNQINSFYVRQSSYFHGTTRGVQMTGVLGATLDVMSLTGGSFCLWAAAV